MDQAVTRDRERAHLLNAAAPLLQAFSGNIWLVHLIIKLPDGRIDKPPAPGFRSNDPSSWISLDDAIEEMLRYPSGTAGIAFAITADMITFDFDNCIGPKGEVVSEIAALIEQLDSFNYRTVSDLGMRVVCRNKADGVPPGKYIRHSEGGQKVEVYVGPCNFYNAFSTTGANGQRIAHRTNVTRALLKDWRGTSGGGGAAGGSGSGNLGALGLTSDLGKRARDQDALLDALATVPHDETIRRDLWVKIGEAVYAGTEGSERGREAFIAWSETWWRHDEAPEEHTLAAEDLWNSYATSPPRTIGAGTVFDLAKKHGWKWPEEKMELDREDDVETEAVEAIEDGDVMPPKFSEAALARRFARRHRKQLRYVAEWGQWLWWDGAVWQKDRTREAFDAARRICEEQAATCVKATQARSLTKASTMRAVLDIAAAMSELAATAGQWDADPWLLNTPGLVVELRTGRLRPPRADDYMTKITAVAPDPTCACPRWLKFLDEIMAGDSGRVDYLQRHCGYSLTGDVSEEMMWFGHGKGRNGKSKFVELRLWIMGDYADTVAMETFTANRNDNHLTELAQLQGLRLVVASETEEGRNWAENRIKLLTGGDRIRARYMRQDFFTFRPQFKLFIIGNHKPRLRNVDEAIKWRLQLVPFSVVIPEAQRDKQLPEKLKAEGAGILAWMIEGTLRWQQQGLAPPKAVREATNDYINTEDTLGSWLEECCETGSGLSESTRQLYLSYQQWMTRAGERHPPTERQFVRALTDRGFIKLEWTNHREPRKLSGLRLHKQEQQEDDDQL